MGFSLSGFLSGASRQYVALEEEKRKRAYEDALELEKLQREQKNAAMTRASAMVGDASFYLTPQMAADLEMISPEQIRLIENQMVPFAAYVKDGGKEGANRELVELLSLRGPGGNILGANLQAYADNNISPEYVKKSSQYNAALSQAMTRIYTQEGGKLGEAQKTIRRQSIINKIPGGYENLSDQSKIYIDKMLAQAANLTIDQAEQRNIIPRNSTRAKQSNGDTNIEPPIRNVGGQSFGLDDVSSEQISQINAMVTSGANTFADIPNDYDTGTKRVTLMLKGYETDPRRNLPMQTSINAMTSLNSFMQDGITIQPATTGALYASPMGMEKIQGELDPVFVKLGFGDTVEIVQAAMPTRFMPSVSGSMVGADPADYDVERQAAFYKRTGGLKQSDYRTKFNDLQKLNATATALIDLLSPQEGPEGKVGLAGKFQLFVSGALSQAEQLFGSDPEGQRRALEFQEKIKKFSGITDENAIGDARTAIIRMLTNELAYNIARSLESATGNARLSQTDVERAAKALGLEGLLVGKRNALAVLEVVARRAQQEMEYANIMASGNVAKMQAAMLTASVYGTKYMLRVNSIGEGVYGVEAAMREFGQAIANEIDAPLPQVGASQPTPTTTRKIGGAR